MIDWEDNIIEVPDFPIDLDLVISIINNYENSLPFICR